jgi:hypothetical protein
VASTKRSLIPGHDPPCMANLRVWELPAYSHRPSFLAPKGGASTPEIVSRNATLPLAGGARPLLERVGDPREGAGPRASANGRRPQQPAGPLPSRVETELLTVQSPHQQVVQKSRFLHGRNVGASCLSMWLSVSAMANICCERKWTSAHSDLHNS